MTCFRLLFIFLPSATLLSAIHSPRSSETEDENGGIISDASMEGQATDDAETYIGDTERTSVQTVDSGQSSPTLTPPSVIDKTIKRASIAVDEALHDQKKKKATMKAVKEAKKVNVTSKLAGAKKGVKKGVVAGKGKKLAAKVAKAAAKPATAGSKPCARSKQLQAKIKALQKQVKKLKHPKGKVKLDPKRMPVPWPTSQPTPSPPISHPTRRPTRAPTAPPVNHPTHLPTPMPTSDRNLPPACATPGKCQQLEKLDEKNDKMEACAKNWAKKGDAAKVHSIKTRLAKGLDERRKLYQSVIKMFGSAKPCAATPKMKADVKKIVSEIRDARHQQEKSETAKKPAAKAKAKKKAVKENEDAEEFTLDIFSEGGMTEAEAELVLTPIQQRLKSLGVPGPDFHQRLRDIQLGQENRKNASPALASSSTHESGDT
eukprot:TRINITY_DN600_c0_g1_i1.p1 TRINITY_DN600_c0_g1~~TRINITY_DN600_c0_g1_i1.p1  ORF type:complete len:431 (-),score=79.66 TRINITY_DN600_c0_g1_i1:19-1311(-)